MYESPIEVIARDISEKLNTEMENKIIYEIERQTEIKVNKEELIKALNYNRNQYDKGYADAEKETDFILHWMTDFLDAPCNYDYAGGFSIANFMLEEGDDWCETHCTNHNHYQCWKKFFELYQNYINEWGK